MNHTTFTAHGKDEPGHELSQRVRRARFLSMAVLAALVAAACGAGSAVSVTSDAPSGQIAQAPTANDQAIADRAVLTLGDLPPGWATAEVDDSDADDMRGIEACVDIVAAMDADNETGLSETVAFADDESDVETEVAVFATEAEAMQLVATWNQTSTPACLQALFEDFAAEDEDFEELDGLEFAMEQLPVESLGDQRVVWEAKVTFLVEGFEVEVFVTAYTVRVGRAVVTLDAIGIFAPVPGSAEYVQATITRLEAEAL